MEIKVQIKISYASELNKAARYSTQEQSNSYKYNYYGPRTSYDHCPWCLPHFIYLYIVSDFWPFGQVNRPPKECNWLHRRDYQEGQRSSRSHCRSRLVIWVKLTHGVTFIFISRARVQPRPDNSSNNYPHRMRDVGCKCMTVKIVVNENGWEIRDLRSHCQKLDRHNL